MHSGLCIWCLERTHCNAQCKLWSYNIITDYNIIIVTFDYTTVTMQILYIKRKGYEIWLKWSTLHLDHTWLFRVRTTTTVHEANPHGNVWRSVWEICMWLKGLNGGYKQTQGYMKGEFSRFMLFPCLKHPAFKFQHMCNQIWQSIKSLRLSYCSCRDGCCMIYPSHVSLIAWRCSWFPLADKTPMTKSYVGGADNLSWSIQKKKNKFTLPSTPHSSYRE